MVFVVFFVRKKPVARVMGQDGLIMGESFCFVFFLSETNF